jgi:hypothetical protein
MCPETQIKVLNIHLRRIEGLINDTKRNSDKLLMSPVEGGVAKMRSYLDNAIESFENCTHEIKNTIQKISNNHINLECE